MPNFTDIYIALILAGAAIAIFLALRIGALPRKSLPWVVASIAGIAGFSIWRMKRAAGLKAELEQQEKQAKAKDIHGSAKSQISSILTPEQQQKWQSMKQGAQDENPEY